MKIVDNWDKDKSFDFGGLCCGDVFIMDGDVYLKTRGDYAVAMDTGIVHTFQYSQDVTPLPNAELHLNK